MAIGGQLGLCVGVQRVVGGEGLAPVGADPGDHDVAGRLGGTRGLHGTDGGATVDGVGARGSSLAAGPGGPDDGVSALEGRGELGLSGLLDGQAQGRGPGGADVSRLSGIADEGDDLVPPGGEQFGQEERDFAVASDDDDAGHDDPFDD